MANQKEIRARISSTISTQQITKAMKLVSATKLRKASEAIIRMRPYAQKLQGIMGNLQESTDDAQLAGYFENRIPACLRRASLRAACEISIPIYSFGNFFVYLSKSCPWPHARSNMIGPFVS